MGVNIYKERRNERVLGYIKKIPKCFLHLIYNSYIFSQGLEGEKKAREKMKSRFVIPNRRNVILFNV